MSSDDSFSEVVTEGWGSRIMGSIKGVLFGFGLVAAAVALLWWNEGRSVRKMQGLEEMGGSVISLNSTIPDPSNNGKLVHVSGELKTNDVLKDYQFGVSFSGIKLERNVQMYQWQEHTTTKEEKETGGSVKKTTTYSYDKGWSSSRSDSSRFKKPEGHSNPAMPYRNKSFEAQNVTLGKFSLSQSQIGMVGGSVKTELKDADLNNLPGDLKGKSKIEEGAIYVSASGRSNSASPEVGDLKIEFRQTPVDTVSIMGVQQGNSFTRFKTKSGNSELMLVNGNVPATQMVQTAQESNSMWTWILRAGGFVLMTIAFGMVFKPLSVVGDVLPILGNILEFGTMLVAGLISFVISFIVIAIAWIAFRPIIGLSLLAVAAAGIGALVYMKMQKKAA